MEILSVIVGALGVILPSLYCIIFEKAFSLEKTIQYVRLKKEKKLQIQYSYSEIQYEELAHLKVTLHNELYSKE